MTDYDWKRLTMDKDRAQIKTVIRCHNSMVIVFDSNGEQIPEYQGEYEVVKERILDDAPLDAVFGRFRDYETELEIVSREDW
jgi:hypothetical protein